jgi:hypothetical protein
MAAQCGFELADMRAFDAAITPETLAATRAAAARRRSGTVARSAIPSPSAQFARSEQAKSKG